MHRESLECDRLERKLEQLLGVARPTPIVIVIDGDVEDVTNMVQVVQIPASKKKVLVRREKVAVESTEGKRASSRGKRSVDGELREGVESTEECAGSVKSAAEGTSGKSVAQGASVESTTKCASVKSAAKGSRVKAAGVNAGVEVAAAGAGDSSAKPSARAKQRASTGAAVLSAGTGSERTAAASSTESASEPGQSKKRAKGPVGRPKGSKNKPKKTSSAAAEAVSGSVGSEGVAHESESAEGAGYAHVARAEGITSWTTELAENEAIRRALRLSPALWTSDGRLV